MAVTGLADAGIGSSSSRLPSSAAGLSGLVIWLVLWLAAALAQWFEGPKGGPSCRMSSATYTCPSQAQAHAAMLGRKLSRIEFSQLHQYVNYVFRSATKFVDPFNLY